jgi:hypothetical protein
MATKKKTTKKKPMPKKPVKGGYLGKAKDAIKKRNKRLRDI